VETADEDQLLIIGEDLTHRDPPCPDVLPGV
jgi:hypothetical protein